MTKTEKAEIISSLTECFKSSDAIVVCDYKGMSVVEFEGLRNQIRSIGGKVQVAKNTLANIALKNAGKEGMALKDTNVFVWGADSLELTKVVAKFATANKDKFVIKQGHIDGAAVDAAYVDALSKTPSKDELIGMLLSVWTAPLRGMVTALDNLAKKKESEAA